MAPAHHQNQQLLLSTTSPSSPSSSHRTGTRCLDPLLVTRSLITSSPAGSTIAAATSTAKTMPSAARTSSPVHCQPSSSSSSSSSSSPSSSPPISQSGSPVSPTRDPCSVSVLAAVTAQVMSRSDKFGGWLPHSGGGMSHVMLIRRTGDRTGIRSASSASTASSDTSTTGYRNTVSTSAVSLESTATSTTTSPTPPSSSSTSPVANNLCDFDGMEEQRSEDQFQIIATRISDENVVLDCLIKKDIVYNNVMPTFHHWISGNSKFGLTFVTSSEGRRFDQAIREVICDILTRDGQLRS